jgi:acetylornithine deacetylase/succinyl-diaminopimelate desuccinylase-like protein
MMLVALLLVAAPSPPAAPLPPPAAQAGARALYQELIEIDTTHDTGSTTAAAEAVARRLEAAGWPVSDIQALGPSPRKGNLVARLRGTGKRRPLMLLGHLDVVAAKREDWTLDPFKLTERDGYFYGRGTQDMKALVTFWIDAVLRLRQEKKRLDRDVIVALTADEENGTENGVEWLIAHHPRLIDAAYALNEGGGGEIKDGRYRANDVQASEKEYFSFKLEATSKGGHSSLPERDNAIVHLADAVGRVHRYQFPARLNEITRSYFARTATFESGQTAADIRAVAGWKSDRPSGPAIDRLSRSPFYNARLRTTCVPTRLEAGHADNALPQRATGLVNCRIFPGETVAEVQAALVAAIGDAAVKVTPASPSTGAPASPLTPELMSAVESVTSAMWPGVVVLPVMLPGATDGRFLRKAGIPTYGVSGLFDDVDDVRAHGRDERIPVRSFYEAQEFVYRLVVALATTQN